MTAVLPGVRRITPKPDAVALKAPRQRRRHRWLPWLVAVLVLEAGAGAAVLAASRVAPHRDAVPHLVGLPVIAANSSLHRAGLTPEVSGALFSRRVAPGRVISQVPSGGEREKAGTIVKMVVSLGRHPTALPRLRTGMTEASALTALRRAHLGGRLSERYSETVAKGTLIGWSSVAGERLFYGDTVKVVISKGPAPQTIPSDLTGGVLDWQQAESVLTGLHLVASEKTQYSTSVPAGYVVNTSPPPGKTVKGHSTVVVYVSLGPPYVSVPSLFSDAVRVAEQKLSSLGLKWQLYGPPGANFVLTQLPAARTPERVGSSVELFLY